jgi:hypothetical protein
MLSMFSIAAARSVPIAKADGSLNVRSVALPAPAGVGVVGTFGGAVDDVCTGAAGGAGVWATAAGAGVDGAATELEDVAGAGLGYSKVRTVKWRGLEPFYTFDTMHTMKPFSSMLYDSTVLSSCKILPVQNLGQNMAHFERFAQACAAATYRSK